jgi:Cu(I)/Ag(I) efflux system membrane fusion protein
MREQQKPASVPGADGEIFGESRTSHAARLRHVGIGVVVLGIALATAVVASRGTAPPREAAGHAHGAASSAESAKTVMLSAEQARRIGVTFAAVERSPLQREIRTVAQVGFDETRVRSVTLKFDGWVERLFVDFTGRDVRAGEPLLATYSPMLLAAEQELVLAAKLVRDVAGADSATRSGAEALRAAARQRLLNWDVPATEIARVEATGAVQQSIIVRAPFAGVVIEKAVLAGQRTMAGDPLFRIADLSVVWLDGEVFERDLALVRVGERVDVELPSMPGQGRVGRIDFVQPTLNANTRTVRVRVAIANGDGALKPGMYATVRIRGGAGAPVLHVPRSAVLSTGTRNLVFVRRADGMLEPRAVVPGIGTDDRVQIQSGVQAGDTVVASATFLVDAESNLGSMLGAMGGMPGMDMAGPGAKGAQGAKGSDVPRSMPVAPMPGMPGMPGMEAPAAAGKAPKPAPATRTDTTRSVPAIKPPRGGGN